MTHELKTWPGPFAAIVRGAKRHEIRRNDRDFSIDDVLLLREWDPDTEKYSGREIRALVSYVTAGGEWGLPDDICVMSIAPVQWARRLDGMGDDESSLGWDVAK